MAVRISVSRGECFPSSERCSSPGVGRRPIAKIEYFALCDAPIMPEKCAPDGYSNGCDTFVQVLLTITRYSTGPAGIAGCVAAGGAALLEEPLPQAITPSKAIAIIGRIRSPLRGSGSRWDELNIAFGARFSLYECRTATRAPHPLSIVRRQGCTQLLQVEPLEQATVDFSAVRGVVHNRPNPAQKRVPGQQ